MCRFRPSNSFVLLYCFGFELHFDYLKYKSKCCQNIYIVYLYDLQCHILFQERILINCYFQFHFHFVVIDNCASCCLVCTVHLCLQSLHLISVSLKMPWFPYCSSQMYDLKVLKTYTVGGI